MNVVAVGNQDVLPYLLRRLDGTDPCSLCGVVTGEEGTSRERILETASELGVETHATGSINTPSAKEFIAERSADVGVCVGWYEVVDPEVLSIPRHGILGVHAAPLPRGRGQAPVNWQIIHGFDRAAVSVFRLTERLDAGPIFAQPTVPVLEDETADSLYDRLIYYGVRELVDVVRQFSSGSPTSSRQRLEEATYWPERRPEDGLLDWELSADVLERLVRALPDPYPSAYTYLDGRKVEVQSARAAEEDGSYRPGEVVDVDPPETLSVGTGDGVLHVSRVRYADAPTLTGAEFAEENDVSTGATLGDAGDFPSDFCYAGLRGPAGRRDLSLETNVSVGEVARNHVYAVHPDGPSDLSLTVRVDDEAVRRDVVTVEGVDCIPVRISPDRRGEHLVRVDIGDDRRRQFYVYATEPE